MHCELFDPSQGGGLRADEGVSGQEETLGRGKLASCQRVRRKESGNRAVVRKTDLSRLEPCIRAY